VQCQLVKGRGAQRQKARHCVVRWRSSSPFKNVIYVADSPRNSVGNLRSFHLDKFSLIPLARANHASSCRQFPSRLSSVGLLCSVVAPERTCARVSACMCVQQYLSNSPLTFRPSTPHARRLFRSLLSRFSSAARTRCTYTYTYLTCYVTTKVVDQ